MSGVLAIAVQALLHGPWFVCIRMSLKYNDATGRGGTGLEEEEDSVLKHPLPLFPRPQKGVGGRVSGVFLPLPHYPWGN